MRQGRLKIDLISGGTNPAAGVMDDVALTRSGGATTVFDKTTKDREVAGRERNTAEAGASVLSVISKGMHLQGNCETDGQLRIEGKISGNVTAHGVELVASGSVDGVIPPAATILPADDQACILQHAEMLHYGSSVQPWQLLAQVPGGHRGIT